MFIFTAEIHDVNKLLRLPFNEQLKTEPEWWLVCVCDPNTDIIFNEENTP